MTDNRKITFRTFSLLKKAWGKELRLGTHSAKRIESPSGRVVFVVFSEKEDSRISEFVKQPITRTKKLMVGKWRQFEDKHDSKKWQNMKVKSINMNVRFNRVTVKWQVFVTDGFIELVDLGTFKPNDENVAINVAKNYMLKYSFGFPKKRKLVNVRSSRRAKAHTRSKPKKRRNF